jgi:hypothetical protein
MSKNPNLDNDWLGRGLLNYEIYECCIYDKMKVTLRDMNDKINIIPVADDIQFLTNRLVSRVPV